VTYCVGGLATDIIHPMISTEVMIMATIWRLSFEQNVNRSGSNAHTPLTVQSAAPVILCTSRCSEAPHELSQLLSDSTRAFSGTPSGMVKVCSYSDRCAGFRETSRAAATSVQLSGWLGAVFARLWASLFHTHKASRLSYSSFYSYKILYIIIWHLLSI